MSKSVAVTQSNYIPWKGYFDIIAQVDEFIILDNVQYTRRDWRNRNLIKTPKGLQWLTIPVQVKGRFTQRINETRVSERDWAEKHWRTIVANYRQAPHFDEYGKRLAVFYERCAGVELLSEINLLFLRGIAELLDIRTPFRLAIDCVPQAEMDTMTPSARLAAVCQAAGARRYLSGPAGKNYLDLAPFEAAGIAVDWMDYSDYLEYPQLWGPFEHGVSIVDLILNTGAEARRFLKTA
ncbi:MAG: WbqC family protein [Alphaproteobacteria bacterium]